MAIVGCYLLPLVMIGVLAMQHEEIKNNSNTKYCQFYDSALCKKQDHKDCYEQRTCEPSEHCFVHWNYDEILNNSVILSKGCWINDKELTVSPSCTVQRTQNHYSRTCICNTDMCNENLVWLAPPPPPLYDHLQHRQPKMLVSLPYFSAPPLLVIIGVCTLILSCIVALVVLIRHRQDSNTSNRHRRRDGLDKPMMELTSQLLTTTTDYQSINLLEKIASGRFGTVWKAQLNEEVVAVKVFPMQGKQSWLSEQSIFKLAQMNHDNVLHFIGTEIRYEDLQTEFWLITAYHEKGSLSDYLKENVLTAREMCRISESMARGLMHLHIEIPASSSASYKPAIAHRDFKSKNVLLKSDMTACIADFGLAIIFQPGNTCGDHHPQVGTRRYMAPEVLEGAINFSKDSFLRIDVYACGLVLWELISRSKINQDDPIGEYKMPFEEELGLYPTVKDMQETVAQGKQRPVISNTWRSHPILGSICETIEECWDHDAEARLSISCVVERLTNIQSTLSSTAIKL